LALDGNDNVYIADAVSLNLNGGPFPFPVTSGTYGFGNTAAGETTDIFVAKIASDGSLVYGTVVAPVDPNAAQYGFYLYMGGLGVDANGNVFVSAGASPGMPTTANAVSPTYPNGAPRNVSNSGQAGFVFALNPDATQLLFATYLPGTNSANALAVASDGSLYAAGTTSESTLPVTPNAFQSSLKGGAGCTCDGGYVIHLSSDGSRILHATYLSGTIDYNNLVTAYNTMALDSAGNVFIGGNVSSPDSPQKNPVVSYLDIPGNIYAYSTYIAGISPDFSTLVFGSYFSGDGAGDSLADIAISPSGHLVLAGGTFSDTNFLTTAGVVQPNAPARADPGVGYQHGFVASIDLTVPAPSVCIFRSVNVGTVTLGTTGTTTATLNNCGNAPLTITSLKSTSTLVTAAPLYSALAAGGSYPLQLQFSPVDPVTTTGSITITSDATVPTQRLFFSGLGLGPQLSIQNPTTINPVTVPQMIFGTSPATAVGLLIRNTGNASLTVTNVSVSGEFTQSSSCVNTITANGICLITARLAPISDGKKQGTLTISSNDPIHPTLVLSLVGNVLINPNSPAITFNIPNHTYGDGPINLVASSASSGAFTYSLLSGPALVSGSTLTINGPGSVQVLATQTASGSYATGTQTVTFQVAPAALAIKANDASRVYGTSNPGFTGVMTGIVAKDSLSQTFATTATLSSPANTYAIVPSVSGAALGNYTVTATNGTLTITQAAATIGMTASSATASPGQSVTLTIAVTSATTGTPAGTVMLQDNGALVTALTLVNGAATYSAALPGGTTHHFSAAYAGDTNFTGVSTSADVLIPVTGADTAFTSSTPAQQATAGSTVTYALQLTPGTGSYPGPVTFSAQGLPTGFTASFSPSTVTVAGSPQTIEMTLRAPVTKAQLAPPGLAPRNSHLALTLAFVLLPLIHIRSLGLSHKRKGIWLAAFCATTLGLLGSTGCSSTPTAATTQPQTQNYTITLTATSGTVQHQTTVRLVW